DSKALAGQIVPGAAAAVHREMVTTQMVAETDSLKKPRTTSAARYLRDVTKRNGKGAFVVLIFFFALTGLFLVCLARTAAVTQGKMLFTRLATTRHVTDAVISPDGKSVAMIVADLGKQSILVKRIATAMDVEILPPAEAQYSGLSFSPDGENVYYL